MASGAVTPLYRRATNEGIQLFLAGSAGLLQTTEDVQFEPCPGLTDAGRGVVSPENIAFTRWLTHLQNGVLTWCETRSGWRTAAAILLMALWGPLSGTSYGIAGLLMLAVSHRLYRAEDRAERLALVACLLAVIPALNLATSDAAAVAGLVMTVLTVGLVSCAGKSLPRFWPGDFFPTFYACHLAVLGVLAL
ncbi:TPA: type-F conjugative transfer system pilin acetylase TraX [Escherichia coli]|nr:type-F conjugative transfer system pilin acetylase TraX [Escherichia coli]